jgi:hypothetical protein
LIHFTMLDHRATQDDLGFIPMFLNPRDTRSAKEQFNTAYAHGGGWRKFEGFTMRASDRAIKYPGDPAFKPLAEGKLRNETILVYPHAWVAIVQPDGTYEIARMD